MRRVRSSAKQKPTTPKGRDIRQNQTFIELSEAKAKQFEHVIEVAEDLLLSGDPNAYDIISQEFEKYDQLAVKLEWFLGKHTKESVAGIFMRLKTITDIYWKLPEQTKELWDANPRLLEWRMKYK
jgi:hypothetical protein